MHVCFALLIGWPMARLVSRRPAKIAWRLYPLWISFVVVATGNHYLTDVVPRRRDRARGGAPAQRLLARRGRTPGRSRRPLPAPPALADAPAEAPA